MKKGSCDSVDTQSYTGKKGELCFAIEWDDGTSKCLQQMAVSLLFNQGIVHPHPPITRALKIVKEKLEAAGHKVIDWKPYDHAKAFEIIGKIYTAVSEGVVLQRSPSDFFPSRMVGKTLQDHVPSLVSPSCLISCMNLKMEHQLRISRYMRAGKLLAKETRIARHTSTIGIQRRLVQVRVVLSMQSLHQSATGRGTLKEIAACRNFNLGIQQLSA